MAEAKIWALVRVGLHCDIGTMADDELRSEIDPAKSYQPAWWTEAVRFELARREALEA